MLEPATSMPSCILNIALKPAKYACIAGLFHLLSTNFTSSVEIYGQKTYDRTEYKTA